MKGNKMWIKILIIGSIFFLIIGGVFIVTGIAMNSPSYSSAGLGLLLITVILTLLFIFISKQFKEYFEFDCEIFPFKQDGARIQAEIQAAFNSLRKKGVGSQSLIKAKKIANMFGYKVC